MSVRGIAALLAIAATAAMGTLSWLRHSEPETTPEQERAVRVQPRHEQSSPGLTQHASSVEELYAQGDSSVAEIVDMLRSGINYPIQMSGEGEEWTTFPTARTALLAMLAELGGVEAARCAEEVAVMTSDPLELALCARIIEEQEPRRDRTILVAAARRLLEGSAPDKAPLLQLLAMLGAKDALLDVERVAAQDGQNSEPAVVALVLMRRDGGDEALLRLLQSPDLPENSRARVAWGVGVAAADDESAQDVFQQMMSDPTVDRQWKQEALNGLETGEIWMDSRLLPKTKVVWALPTSKWIAARLEVLDRVEPGIRDQLVVAKLQQVRDELVEELERSQ
jgi:hypothetical protein